MHEQDLFALKSIKIPVQKHSFLTETDVSDYQEVPRSSATLKPLERARAHPHLEEVTDFLMEVDHDIEKLIQTANDHGEDSLDNSVKRQRFDFRGACRNSHGADWGIQWWNAVVVMLLIGIILPLFYVIYFKIKDNGVVSSTDGSGAILSHITSPNASGTGLITRGVENLQEPDSEKN